MTTSSQVASYGSYGRGQAADECAECSATSKHIQMRKYCEMDYVYLVSENVIEKSFEVKHTCTESFTDLDKLSLLMVV